MKPLLLCLLLTLPAAAQRKLWTWTPPGLGEDVGFKLITSATASNGATAIIYALLTFDETGGWDSVDYRAALISPKGQQIGADLGYGSWTYNHFVQLQDHVRQWQPIMISKSAIILTDGENVLKFSIKGKTGSIVNLRSYSEVTPVISSTLGGSLGLPSFLKYQRGQEVGHGNWPILGVPGHVGNTKFYAGGPIELWSLK